MSYCSQCELIHGDEHRFCQRCGQLLKRSPAAASRPCTRCGALTFSGQKFCIDCGLPLKAMPLGREEPAAERRAPLFYPRSPESRPRRRKRRPGMAISIVLLALVALAGFFGWQYLVKKPSVPPPSIASVPRKDLRRDVERLAEKIRAAHISKDINKWLSCYDPNYPNLGRLEHQILELWKNYDIRDVSYRINNIRWQGDRQASAELVWNITLYDHRTDDYTLLRQAYTVSLEKASDGWRIRKSQEKGAS